MKLYVVFQRLNMSWCFINVIKRGEECIMMDFKVIWRFNHVIENSFVQTYDTSNKIKTSNKYSIFQKTFNIQSNFCRYIFTLKWYYNLISVILYKHNYLNKAVMLFKIILAIHWHWKRLEFIVFVMCAIFKSICNIAIKVKSFLSSALYFLR